MKPVGFFVIIIISFGIITSIIAGNFMKSKVVPKTEASSEKDEIHADKGEEIVFRNISPHEAKRWLDEEDGIILLDVRTQEEYREKHIPNSVLIPVDVLEKKAIDELKDKSSTIIVYCRSGRRSVTASEILVKLGYTNVFNLGGILDWPYETK